MVRICNAISLRSKPQQNISNWQWEDMVWCVLYSVHAHTFSTWTKNGFAQLCVCKVGPSSSSGTPGCVIKVTVSSVCLSPQELHQDALLLHS